MQIYTCSRGIWFKLRIIRNSSYF